jgi:hypothetical protein
MSCPLNLYPPNPLIDGGDNKDGIICFPPRLGVQGLLKSLNCVTQKVERLENS